MSEYVLMLHEYFVIPNLDPIEYQNVDDYEIDSVKIVPILIQDSLIFLD